MPPLGFAFSKLHLKLRIKRSALLQVRAQFAQQIIPRRRRHDGPQVAEGGTFYRLGPVQAAVKPVAEPGGTVGEIQFPKSIAARLHGKRAGRRQFAVIETRIAHASISVSYAAI